MPSQHFTPSRPTVKEGHCPKEDALLACNGCYDFMTSTMRKRAFPAIIFV